VLSADTNIAPVVLEVAISGIVPRYKEKSIYTPSGKKKKIGNV